MSLSTDVAIALCFLVVYAASQVVVMCFVEVVERKGARQAQQPGVVRQGHVRQVVQGGAAVQADHAVGRVRASEGARLAGEEGAAGAAAEGADQAGGAAQRTGDLHQDDKG